MTEKPDFTKQNGLLPVIVQSVANGKVLMLAYMNQQAWDRTVATGKAHFWSRSRKKLWMKGEESGNIQIVRDILIDCDADTILLKVDQMGGAACHTGFETCFHRRLDAGRFQIEGVRIFDPREVYNQ